MPSRVRGAAQCLRARATRTGPDLEYGLEQFLLALVPERRVFSVTELNAAIRGVLDTGFPDVWVSGEISGVKMAASGHCYFTLKERDSQIGCACFRGTLRYLKFKPQDGIAVLVRGRIDVFEARGQYQLLVETLQPQGHGALQLAFDQLKKKLAAEGLFDPARRRALPRFPARIGIVTSPRGAVISDMVQILGRRFPGLHIRLYPALVQGEGSIEDVCGGIQYFSRSGWPEVVIIARGGGSLEDLWTFNEEAVARAIAACAMPVVSAIGHETDVTIADFVADLRAPTPSAAAEMIVCTRQEVLERIAASRQKLSQSARYRLAMVSRRLQKQGIERATSLLHRFVGRQLQNVDEKEFRMRERLRHVVELRQRRRRNLEEKLRYYDLRPRLQRDRNRWVKSRSAGIESMKLQLTRNSRRVEMLAAKLSQLSPLRILDRGYAIVTAESGEIVKAARSAPAGSKIRVRLAAGGLQAHVTESNQ